MPQKKVPLLRDESYHLFNRGVDKREIFLDKEDYLRFYQSLYLFNTREATVNFESARNRSKKDSVREKLVEIKAYSLLPNHFHILITQTLEGGISEFMRRVSTGYTSYFNQKYDRSGALFQGRFKRVHISSNEQYMYLFAYVNENHFVHNVKISREVCHSSSLHYQGLVTSKLINKIEDHTTYKFSENKDLAIDIFNKRMVNKADKELLE